MFLGSTVTEILGESQNYKNASRDPHVNHFDLILHFSLDLIVLRLRAKFVVSSFNRSRDIQDPKLSKVGYVTPT